ncbi:MAG TPA: transglycosylase domain-containing protein [Pseudogracilibacillus sp.]|nr:transglycosylase domain-containing protein [Pseudogracilibacillus sp.]
MEGDPFPKRMLEKIKKAWRAGTIQRTSRVTYDVAWNILLIFIVIAGILVVFAGGVGAGYFASLVKDEPIPSYQEMENDIYDYEQTSKLYFDDDKLIGNIKADIHREKFSVDKAPDVLVDAVIATEDDLFYEHHGVVPKAVIRAMYQEATGAESSSGGSTLTQQLVKNQILTNEVSFERKAKEMLLAMRVERYFEKDEIMEAYLNIIPYGREASGTNIAGIKTAAKGVFDEKVEDLNLPQAAFLAGIPKNPYLYTPFTNKGKLKDEEELEAGVKRMKVVLKRMYNTDFISKEEYEEALDYDIAEDFTDKTDPSLEEHPALVFELQKRARKILKEQLAEEDDVSKEDLDEDDSLNDKYNELAEKDMRTEGYEIHSTIDKEMYKKMKEIGDNYGNYGPNNEHDQKEQAGAVLAENDTGKVLSFYPGRDIKRGESEFNYAMGGKGRLPGSTMKPLATYAPAIELGEIQPGSVILDAKYPGEHRTKNYGGGYYGLVSARDALANSYNVVAEEIYDRILDENPAKNYVSEMGIPVTESDQETLQFGTGGVDYGVTVEQNTNAFGTLSNQGDYVPSYMIEEITDADGETIYEHESKEKEVFSPQTAYLTLDMMRDVISDGTGTAIKSQLNNNDVDWAGKTGTSTEYKDSWFMGTNPNVTLGTWMGYETPTSVYCEGCSLSYSDRNQHLWAAFVNGLAEIDADLVTPSDKHKKPDGLVTKKYCATSGDKPSELCEKAGLVEEDLYDKEETPSDKDDSLTESSKGKYKFKKEWIKDKGYDDIIDDPDELIPRKHEDKWKKVEGSQSSEDDDDENNDDNDND